MAREPVAVIDIGSNSGRVMVYRREAGGHLHVLAGSRASLRLVRELDRTGRIPAEALERAFEALRDFRSIARGSGVRRIVAAGTSALRDAANGPAFIRRYLPAGGAGGLPRRGPSSPPRGPPPA